MQYPAYNVLSTDSVEKKNVFVYVYRDSQCDKMLTANLGAGYIPCSLHKYAVNCSVRF